MTYKTHTEACTLSERDRIHSSLSMALSLLSLTDFVIHFIKWNETKQRNKMKINTAIVCEERLEVKRKEGVVFIAASCCLVPAVCAFLFNQV